MTRTTKPEQSTTAAQNRQNARSFARRSTSYGYGGSGASAPRLSSSALGPASRSLAPRRSPVGAPCAASPVGCPLSRRLGLPAAVLSWFRASACLSPPLPNGTEGQAQEEARKTGDKGPRRGRKQRTGQGQRRPGAGESARTKTATSGGAAGKATARRVR